MKKECLALIDSLNESEKVLLQQLKKKKGEAVRALLADMQQAAVTVGTEIEQQEGADAPAVAMLEEYCELLYQCYIDEMLVSVQTQKKDREKLLKHIRRSILKTMRDIKEIAFFPYKASMWDSLESVWKAVSKDPNFRTFVVPIPYYEKLPDGSFGQMRYEGALFPNDVPVYDWQEYNVESRKPDVIFIHNPYDNNNFVTSVHPDFYAERLKKLTDNLVYISYCSGSDSVSEGLCVNPGTIYSDHVIVESEPALRCYKYFFKEFVLHNKLKNVFPDKKINDKFLLLGSPKIDKAIHCKREDYVLPEEWKQIISGRKVVLYNTSLGGLLAGNEQGLKKIEDVLRVFQQRKDVALWWRPHPLSKATFASMRPHLQQKYQSIVEWYRKENFGVYDDTSDLYRAVAYTDMYYGDGSSLEFLYGAQGKPILVQSRSYITSDENNRRNRSLAFENFVEENGIIWFTGKYVNHLFQMDLESGIIRDLGEIPGEDASKVYLYGEIYKQGDNIWIVPETASELAKFNLEKREFSKLSLPETIHVGFQTSLLEDDELYMLSRDYRYLLIVNLEYESMRLEELAGYNSKGLLHHPHAHPNICKVNNCLYFSADESNIIVEYDLTKKKTEYFEVGAKKNKYTHVFYDGENFWLVPRRYAGPVVRWNRESMGNWEIEDDERNIWHTQKNWYGCVQSENSRLLLWNSTLTMAIDLKTMEFEAFKQDDPAGVYCVRKTETDILLSQNFAGNRQVLKKLGPDGECVHTWLVDIPDDMSVMEESSSPFCASKYDLIYPYFLYETNTRNIQTALDWLVRSDSILEGERETFRELFVNGDGTAGEKIAQHILGLN